MMCRMMRQKLINQVSIGKEQENTEKAQVGKVLQVGVGMQRSPIKMMSEI